LKNWSDAPTRMSKICDDMSTRLTTHSTGIGETELVKQYRAVDAQAC